MKKTWTYQFWNSQFYIENWAMYMKKTDEKNWKKIEKEKMIEICDYYKWTWKIYQPMAVNIYRAWKNWQLNTYKGLLID